MAATLAHTNTLASLFTGRSLHQFVIQWQHISRINVPNKKIVLPDLVKMPQGPTFCFWRVFWTAEVKRPTPPVTMVVLMARLSASWG